MEAQPFPGATAVVHDSDKPRWLAERCRSLGSSSARPIHGVGYSNESGVRLFAELMAEDPGPDIGTEWMKACRGLEQGVLDLFLADADLSGAISGWLYRSKDMPWLHATIDGWCYTPDDRVVPIELKVEADKAQWEDGEIPRRVWVQAQHHCAVLGSEGCYVVALVVRLGVRWKWVPADRAWINGIHLPRCKTLFEAARNREAPPLWLLDSDEETGRALAELYPTSDGDTVTLDASFNDLDAERLEALEAIKAGKAEKARVENLIKASIGEASRAVLPNGTVYTWQPTTRKAHEVAASSFRTLRRKGP